MAGSLILTNPRVRDGATSTFLLDIDTPLPSLIAFHEARSFSALVLVYWVPLPSAAQGHQRGILPAWVASISLLTDAQD